MKLLLRYPLVAGTVAALLAVLILLLSGHPLIAQISASIYALAVAAHLAVGMVRRLIGGRWGIDILAVTAIVSTVLVGEFIASQPGPAHRRVRPAAQNPGLRPGPAG